MHFSAKIYYRTSSLSTVCTREIGIIRIRLSVPSFNIQRTVSNGHEAHFGKFKMEVGATPNNYKQEHVIPTQLSQLNSHLLK